MAARRRGRPTGPHAWRRLVVGLVAALAVAAVVLVLVPAVRGDPARRSGGATGVLAPAGRLAAGEYRESPSRSHRLTVQPDGDVVLAEGPTHVWSTGTAGNPGAVLVLGADGALRVVSGAGTQLWTNGIVSPGARLVLTDAGRLSERSADGTQVWSDASAPAGAEAGGTSDRVLSGAALAPGQAIATSTGSHRLVVQGDGDVVLLAGTTVLWRTGTAGHPGAHLEMRADGTIAVVGADGAAVWSNGAAAPGARLVVVDDGRLYEIASSGEAVWSTTTAPTYLAVAGPYINPASPAATAARTARAAGRAADAALLDKAAVQGSARWLTPVDTTATVEATVRDYAAAAQAVGQTPVFVTYAIPDRDCGSQSAGGLPASGYRTWAGAVARGLVGSRSVVIVEPDSLLHVYRCGNSNERFDLVRTTSAAYTAAGAEVYLDAGSSNSFGNDDTATADMAARLRSAGVADVAGFATNVSNFQTTADEAEYGHRLSAMLDGARFVIDTSRNGNGSVRDDHGVIWCNPPGRALGDRPGATQDGAHVANLWIKTVGLSDGACNGGPPAGTYWEGYLLGLAAAARW